MTIKDSKYINIYGVNPSYLIFNKVDGYFEEINGNKFLALVSTNEGNNNNNNNNNNNDNNNNNNIGNNNNKYLENCEVKPKI